MSNHKDHCASLHSFRACDCGLKSTTLHTTDCKVWNGAGQCTCAPSDDDGVKQPSHYRLFEGVEAIEVIARSMTQEMFKGYCLGNILKYRLRAGKKSELATLEKDMAKAAFYLELYEKHKGLCHD
ncbi:nucleotide kinase [Klebsiella phage KP32_isolate 196]|uniref:Nucleotide kinase n=1 Tax=Klebsiella phage KP32_isolate 196 TaxID=2790307 RepID=A0A2U8USS1_9CAUD|nr:nucleotide kinase [Klebsiella phage KP32_isolate 196]AWN07188.1 nucleotide kinase [Klebsiella phage KP32_isolate 196]